MVYKFDKGTRYFGRCPRAYPFKKYLLPEQGVSINLALYPDMDEATEFIRTILVEAFCIDTMNADVHRDISIEISEEEIVCYSTSGLDGCGFIMKWVPA